MEKDNLARTDPSATVVYRCPNCAGVLRYDNEKKHLTCAHCQTEYSKSEVSVRQPVSSGESAAFEDVPKLVSDGDFLENASWESGAPVSKDAELLEYTCPSCGAFVAAAPSAISLPCPYCSNNLLVAGAATKDDLPDCIVPFSIGREEALEIVRGHVLGRPLSPKGLELDIEHMRAVYVPFFIYDVKARFDTTYAVYEDYAPTMKRLVLSSFPAVCHDAKATLDIRGISQDASKTMPDDYMDALGFYPLPRKKKFSPEYYAGYYTEIADEDAQAPRKKLERLVSQIMHAEMAAAVSKKSHGSYPQVFKEEGAVEIENATTVSMPVWLFHAKVGKNDMLVAVNGHDGSVAGNVAIDDSEQKKRRRRTVAVAAGIWAALAVLFTVVSVAQAGTAWSSFERIAAGNFLIAALVLIVAGVVLSRQVVEDDALMEQMEPVADAGTSRREQVARQVRVRLK